MVGKEVKNMRFSTSMGIGLMLTFSCCTDNFHPIPEPKPNYALEDPEIMADTYHDSILPFAWRLPREWRGKWKVIVRESRTFADVEYQIRDLALKRSDGMIVPSVRLFITRNRTGSLSAWLENVWPGVTGRFRIAPVEIGSHLSGLHLVQTASLRPTHPDNFPFPDTLALEDTGHYWVGFPTLLSDHSVLLEYGVDETDFDSRLWTGILLDDLTPPSPVAGVEGFGDACGRGYSEQFGVFRGVPMYSNGDCTGRGRGRYTTLEFISRLYSAIRFDGLIEDLPQRIVLEGGDSFLPHEAGIPRFRDLFIFGGGREGHAAVVKHVYCFSPRVCRLVLIEQNWWGDDASIGRIVVYSELAGEIIVADADSPRYPLRAIIRFPQTDPNCDNDGDGVAETQGDCDDTDPWIFPREHESFLHMPSGGEADEIPACNGRDDNCDGETDEEFRPFLGGECDHPCSHKGVVVCDPSGRGRVCAVDPTTTAPEMRNGLDDDCDGIVDDGWAPTGTCAACSIDRDCHEGFRCLHFGGPRNYCLPPCAQGRPLCQHQFLCEADVAGMPQTPDWRCIPKNLDLCEDTPD